MIFELLGAHMLGFPWKPTKQVVAPALTWYAPTAYSNFHSILTMVSRKRITDPTWTIMPHRGCCWHDLPFPQLRSPTTVTGVPSWQFVVFLSLNFDSGEYGYWNNDVMLLFPQLPVLHTRMYRNQSLPAAPERCRI